MSEDNKQFVLRFFDNLSNGRPEAFEMFAPDATWWILPLRRALTIEEYKVLGKEMFKHFKGPPQLSIKNIVAEGDRVVLEAEGQVGLTNGKHYNNFYFFLFTVADGKIRQIREYFDTKYAVEMIGYMPGA